MLVRLPQSCLDPVVRGGADLHVFCMPGGSACIAYGDVPPAAGPEAFTRPRWGLGATNRPRVQRRAREMCQDTVCPTRWAVRHYNTCRLLLRLPWSCLF